ncbi:MAG: hypothetical protein QUV35_17140 [Hydrogenophaga sp.]|nr:hypothetical protein [Hydrogenophaga sp.]MDM7944348.1 hypothetical protein [Hydrogenophaga sp.]
MSAHIHRSPASTRSAGRDHHTLTDAGTEDLAAWYSSLQISVQAP